MRGGKKKGKNHEILGLHCVAKKFEGWLKICILFLVLDMAKSWLPLFLHVPMDDCHFGYTQKFLEPITYIPLGMLATNVMLENWKRKTLMKYIAYGLKHPHWWNVFLSFSKKLIHFFRYFFIIYNCLLWCSHMSM